jgi:hypothetical protein
MSTATRRKTTADDIMAANTQPAPSRTSSSANVTKTSKRINPKNKESRPKVSTSEMLLY